MDKPYVSLVGMDYSELADRALQEAFAQASQRANSEVHVISVLPVTTDFPGDAVSAYATLDEKPLLEKALQRLRAHVDQALERFRADYPQTPVQFRVISHAHVDTPVHGIVQLAADIGADLIVVGTHNRKGLERFLLGSVAEGTVRNARCPVLVIPSPPRAESEIPLAPPCPECVKARAASGGKDFWCEQHSQRHGRRHTYHQSDRSGGESNFPLVYR
ncbi:MAG TPA: universal stress protein [Polyangiaceae bacterium]|nr:universal stress protein [Polyangiaceae bacterium]